MSILLIAAVVRYKVLPVFNKQTSIIKQPNKITEKILCSYELKHFDFHYKNEIDNPNIIMLGNSIIRQGNWSELLKRDDVINRGIAGDNLDCMCERLDYLKDKKAKIWFLEGGINDLPHKSPEYIFRNYIQIINFVKKQKAQPVINLVTYISPKAGIKYSTRSDYKLINGQVKKLNKMLIDYAEKNKIEYIDLNSEISERNVILDKYTYDGVHLTESAYKVWAKRITEILEKKNI